MSSLTAGEFLVGAEHLHGQKYHFDELQFRCFLRDCSILSSDPGETLQRGPSSSDVAIDRRSPAGLVVSPSRSQGPRKMSRQLSGSFTAGFGTTAEAAAAESGKLPLTLCAAPVLTRAQADLLYIQAMKQQEVHMTQDSFVRALAIVGQQCLSAGVDAADVPRDDASILNWFCQWALIPLADALGISQHDVLCAAEILRDPEVSALLRSCQRGLHIVFARYAMASPAPREPYRLGDPGRATLPKDAQQVKIQLVCDKDAWSRLHMTIKFFDAQLSALRRVQLTTSSVTQGLMTLSHIKFRQSTEDAWRGSMKGVAAVVDDLVAAELSGSQRISEDLLEHLKETQKRLDKEIFKARSEIMYHTGSQFVEAEQQLNHHLAHVNRMACYFAINELISVTVSQARDAVLHRPRTAAGGLRSLPWKCLSWFKLPSRERSHDALKKVISLGVLSIGAWIPEWRAKRPEFIWAFIAASFIFSDLQGSSISTGLGRVIGTVFGGMVGFITLELFNLIDWPSKALEIAAYIAVCVFWTFGCSLSRSSPRHGYTCTVAGFSIYIMVVGTLESFGRKSSSEVVFQRMQEQFAGAVIYITVEMLLWRKSARTIVDEQQITILTAIKDDIVEATEPHLLIASEESEAALRGQSMQSDGLSVATWSPDRPGSALVTENSGSLRPRNLEATTPQEPQSLKSFKSQEKRESHNRMEEIYRAGNHALEAAKQGLVAATFEPTWWHKPFPMADFQRLLHTEEKALRLLHVLCAATHSAPPETLDHDVPALVANYCHAALNSLEEAIAHLERLSQDKSKKEWLHLTIDSHEYLASSFGLGSNELPDADNQPSKSLGLEALLQLFAVQRADQKLRENLEKHFLRFRTSDANPNPAAFSTNTTMRPGRRTRAEVSTQ
eukprot:s21_g33.t2